MNETTATKDVMPPDEVVEAAMVKVGDAMLLLLAWEKHRDSIIDTWWRQCEGRFTEDIQTYLPGVTDAELLAFLKRFAENRRDATVGEMQSWVRDQNYACSTDIGNGIRLMPIHPASRLRFQRTRTLQEPIIVRSSPGETTEAWGELFS